MKHIGLFEGIGGFSLAARWMGWETIAWCEWNEYCQKILKQHFKEAQGHGDITQTDFTIYRGKCNILTGGFPCQPYSLAGQRKGKEDERHLWPEMLRAIREIQPEWVVGENVPGLLNWNGGMVLHEIKTDLENEGFEVFPPLVLPACAVDADHRRDRVWIVAHTKSSPRIHENKNEGQNTQAVQKIRFDGNRKSEPGLFGGTDGVPDWMDRVKALGNSIVPQVAFNIFKSIVECQNEMMNKERMCGVGEKNRN